MSYGRNFDLFPFLEAYNTQLPTAPIRAINDSAVHSNLRVIDKDNGGKADSLNAGISLLVYPLFCCIDADSIHQPDSLPRAVQPFLGDHCTVASGRTVRIANGCRVENGFLTTIGLPINLLALFQIVEYLRAFLFGRLGWSPMNAMLIGNIPDRRIYVGLCVRPGLADLAHRRGPGKLRLSSAQFRLEVDRTVSLGHEEESRVGGGDDPNRLLAD
jgi:cellulose synthase/poly-beta-1,6-N-acetylglucosamine synthase-like glycosyltransferase